MKVSISYAHTSKEHENKVRLLTEKLANNGIDLMIDMYDLEAGDDLYYFMERLVLSDDVKFILVICNQLYKEKADSYKGGVGNEAANLRRLASIPANSKVIPVIFEKSAAGIPALPNFLLTKVYVDLCVDNDFTSEEFEYLVGFLKGSKKKDLK